MRSRIEMISAAVLRSPSSSSGRFGQPHVRVAHRHLSKQEEAQVWLATDILPQMPDEGIGQFQPLLSNQASQGRSGFSLHCDFAGVFCTRSVSSVFHSAGIFFSVAGRSSFSVNSS